MHIQVLSESTERYLYTKMNKSLYKGWKSIQKQLTWYFYNPQNCLTAIHQLWNPPPQCSFLQLCLLLHSGTQKLKYSSGHQARWHSKWCSWLEQGREVAVLFSSVFSWLTPLTGICRGTTAEHLREWIRADGKTDLGHSWESNTSAEPKYYSDIGGKVQNFFKKKEKFCENPLKCASLMEVNKAQGIRTKNIPLLLRILSQAKL